MPTLLFFFCLLYRVINQGVFTMSKKEALGDVLYICSFVYNKTNDNNVLGNVKVPIDILFKKLTVVEIVTTPTTKIYLSDELGNRFEKNHGDHIAVENKVVNTVIPGVKLHNETNVVPTHTTVYKSLTAVYSQVYFMISISNEKDNKLLLAELNKFKDLITTLFNKAYPNKKLVVTKKILSKTTYYETTVIDQ